MAIQDAKHCLYAYPTVTDMHKLTNDYSEWCRTDWYLSEEGVNQLEPGSVLLVPTYRLEEVEEIVEPEKPEVPVEPYVGMVIPFESGDGQFVVCGNMEGEWCLVTFQPDGFTEIYYIRDLPAFLPFEYPRTPSTPAVTRRVKKWIKIEQPSVDSNG